MGKLEEISFEEEARTWAGIAVSEKLPKNGDYILAYPRSQRRSAGAVHSRGQQGQGDRHRRRHQEADPRRQGTSQSRSECIVAREESQLRQLDRERRWGQEDGIWVLRTTRHWLPRDLEVLKPVFERMRTEGPNFLQRNSALAEEIRRTFVDLDEVEKELKKAAKAIDAVSDLTAKYRSRLRALCDTAASSKVAPKSERNGGIPQTLGA